MACCGVGFGLIVSVSVVCVVVGLVCRFADWGCLLW